MKLIDSQEEINYLFEQYTKHGAEVKEINIFGIRDESDIKQDVWNDVIGIFTEAMIFIAEATTDPSVYYTLNPMNKKGTAHLALGYQPDIWVIGKHGKEQYTALINRWGVTKSQRVWRDVDKDFKFTNKDIIDKGWFACNLHRGSKFEDLIKIGKYSAGCQVIRRNYDFNEFMGFIFSSEMGKKNKTFSYMLFDTKQIELNSLKEI